MEPPRPSSGKAQRGRKRKSTDSTEQPKERQRGMGVEQLERIRNMTEITHPFTQSYYPAASSGLIAYCPTGQTGYSPMGLALVSPLGGGYGFGGLSTGLRFAEASRDLTSVPNLNQYFWSQYYGFSNKETEVMALHRKKDSTVLMEYDFFPKYNKNGNADPKDDEAPSSSITTTTARLPTPPTSIDLSLKL